MKVKNWVIRDICSMLETLSQKRLAERDNEKRVATLLRRHFSRPKKAMDDDHNAFIAANPAPDGWDGELPPALVEVRMTRWNALMEEEQDVGDIPAHLYLTEKDLPKIMKGELGDQNRVGTSMIIAKLHFLYKLDGEDETVADGKDGADAVVEAD